MRFVLVASFRPQTRMASRSELKITNQDDQPEGGGQSPGTADSEADCEDGERSSLGSGLRDGVNKRWVPIYFLTQLA